LPFFTELMPGRSTVIHDHIRQWAALGLGRIGGDAAANALAEGLSSSNAQVRLAVAAALGNTKSQAAIPLLVRMYSDYDNTHFRFSLATKRRTIHSDPRPPHPASGFLLTVLSKARNSILPTRPRSQSALPIKH
jgi:HEAT repeats